MDWAERRKLFYITILLIVIGGFAALLIRNATAQVPTCFDGKKNGGEVGTDCGGGCAMYCPNELGDPKIRWVRVFPMAPGIVHAIAYIEHSYPTAAARNVPYVFRLYDDKNTLIVEKNGSTFIGTMGKSAIVETLIKVGNTTPVLARFSFGTVPWEKIPVTYSQTVIKTDRTMVENFQHGTRLTATLENTSNFSFTDMEAVAILYDSNDNAVTASKALVPLLPARASKVVYFTWPQELKEPPTRIEVIPRFNPFTSQSL